MCCLWGESASQQQGVLSRLLSERGAFAFLGERERVMAKPAPEPLSETEVRLLMEALVQVDSELMEAHDNLRLAEAEFCIALVHAEKRLREKT